jgi:hypothetical protein
MTRPTLRWAVAVLVTIAAFAAATWVCGAFVLPMHDGGVRWGIAGGLGVAVAALAALWGHSYATAEHEHEHPDAQTAHAAPARAGRTGNKISGGTFHGPVIQGRDIGTLNLADPATGEHAQAPPAAADNPPAEG